MKHITISIPDDRLLKLEKTANNMGVSVEELLLMGVEAVVNQPEDSFNQAIAYVLNKNAELYQRLQ
jgi:antitoxin FitA